MKLFLQTPNWPIHFLSLLSLSLASQAWAHDLSTSDIPHDSSWKIGAGIAGAYVKQQDDLPALPVSGVLGSGYVQNDLQGWRFEHGAVSAGARFNPWLGAQVGVGWHDQDEMHWESAWLELQTNDDKNNLVLGLGRNDIPVGAVWQQAGHFDRFMQQPLIKQTYFDGDWIANGAAILWQRQQGDYPWFKQMVISAWQEDDYPQGEQSNIFPVVSVGFGGREWSLDLFATSILSKQRQTDTKQASVGHSHDVSSCSPIQNNVACFDGRSTIVGASSFWQSPIPSLQLRWAGAWRKEDGSLKSTTSNANYDSESWGGWIEPSWQISSEWETAVRYEWIKGDNTLNGIGASLLAKQSRLYPNLGAERGSLILAWRPEKSWLISLEGGLDNTSGSNNAYGAIRVVWQLSDLISGRW